jgi:hypothetical protein
MKPLLHFFSCFLLFLTPVFVFAQTPAKWNVNGNATTTGDFLGTTNNQPLLFYTNNIETMRLKTNGELRIYNLGGFGNGFVTANNNGVLGNTPFTNDTTQVLTGDGTFRNIAAFNPWQQNGNNIFLSSGKVGIGTNNPQFKLDVNGNAHFNGTVYANAINLLNKMEADTIKGVSMVEVNNNLELSGGTLNQVYTKTGDLRLQSHLRNNGNLLLAAGTTGNVGVGVFSPQYKFDVNGDARVSGSIRTQRIRPLPGDTVVIIGDSSIWFSSTNKIYPTTTNPGFRGIAMGSPTSSAHGQNSLALGTRVWTTGIADYAIVLGSGALAASLRNDIPNSLMIGFNSNIPTLFVGTSAGVNTIGKVGIGTTTPQTELQINDGIKRINISSGTVSANGVLGYMGFNAEINSSSYMHTTGDGTTNTGGIISLASDGSLRFNVLPNSGGNDLLQDPIHFAGGAQMRIYNSHVEIGQGAISSASPYYNDVQTKLMVGGRIMCQDVIVSLVDWQDEVFDSAYSLLPMDSVNAYIQANGHLPGVPAENKIETEGMSVTQTAQLQQAKIEEMMLYILQLNERMKALEAENAKLKAHGN